MGCIAHEVSKSQTQLSDLHFETIQEGFPLLHSPSSIYCLQIFSMLASWPVQQAADGPAGQEVRAGAGGVPGSAGP